MRIKTSSMLFNYLSINSNDDDHNMMLLKPQPPIAKNTFLINIIDHKLNYITIKLSMMIVCYDF